MNPTDSPSLVGRILHPGPTRQGEPLAASGKAGCNLPAAVTTTIALIMAASLPLVYVSWLFVVFIGVPVLIGLWELGGVFARLGTSLVIPPLYTGTIGMLTCAWTLGLEALLSALYTTFFAVATWRILEGDMKGCIRDVMASVFAAVYILFLASFVVPMVEDLQDPWLAFVYAGLVVASDTGGRVAGVLFGKHPMAPRLPPKKSWEGFAGSSIAAAGLGVASFWALGAHWGFGVLAGLGVCMIGTLGDLTESLIKGKAGLKDMSALLPGHGGILDRVDALLMVAPIMYLILSWTLLGAQ